MRGLLVSVSFVVFQHDKETLDPRGRTPLHLAVSLGYADCAKCLLRSGCDANAINKDGWNGTDIYENFIFHSFVFEYLRIQGYTLD